MGKFSVQFNGTICHVIESGLQRALLPDGTTSHHKHFPWLSIRKKDRDGKPAGFEEAGDCWVFRLNQHEVGFTNVVPAAATRSGKFSDAAANIARIGTFSLLPQCRTTDPSPEAIAYMELNGSLDACYTKEDAATGNEPQHRYAQRVFLDGDTSSTPTLFLRKFNEPVTSAQTILFDRDNVEIGIWNIPEMEAHDPSHFELHYRLFTPSTGPTPVKKAIFPKDECRSEVCGPKSGELHILSAGPGCSNTTYP